MRSKNHIKGGFVYIFKNNKNEFKVGSTNNVRNRLSNIKCGCPSAELLFKSEVLSNRLEVEKAAHTALLRYSAGGEWFDCSELDVLSAVNESIFNIGKVVGGGQVIDSEEFESRLNWVKVQRTGVLCEINSKSQKHIIERYKLHLETTCLKQLSWFVGLCDSEQFLQAATVIANTFIKQEQLDFDGGNEK